MGIFLNYGGAGSHMEVQEESLHKKGTGLIQYKKAWPKTKHQRASSRWKGLKTIRFGPKGPNKRLCSS